MQEVCQDGDEGAGEAGGVLEDGGDDDQPSLPQLGQLLLQGKRRQPATWWRHIVKISPEQKPVQ